MKHWIARLFGAASPRRDAHPGPTSPPSAPDLPEVPAALSDAEAIRALDLAFYRWLAAGGGAATPASEALLMDELARLARTPAQAAELVPRVPAVIPELLRSLRDDRVSSADLARKLAQDVVLVGEVIREANSSWYRPPAPVRSIDGALMLLGRDGLRMLLARVAFRPVLDLQGGPAVKRVAPRIWSQSERCALAAGILAPGFGADPFEACLAGLVKNVGLVLAFRVAEQVSKDAALPAADAAALGLLAQARRLSHGIALHWQFPETIAGAILEDEGEDATPLARSLATGDRLAALRVLVDAGALAADDPLSSAIVGTRLRPCYDRLSPGQPEQD